MLGHGDLAWQYFRATLPSAWNDRAEVREIEPYVYCQFTHSKSSPRFGASRVPWLSGSAAWSYFTATQYILGLQPDYGGLRIDPCIPAAWKGFNVTRLFRGKKVHVEVHNPAGVQKGVRSLVLNGEPLEGNFIPAENSPKKTACSSRWADRIAGLGGLQQRAGGRPVVFEIGATRVGMAGVRPQAGRSLSANRKRPSALQPFWQAKSSGRIFSHRFVQFRSAARR